MIYQYQADDGEILEIHRSMHQAPAIGSTIRRSGKTFVRIISACHNGTAYDSESYPKLSSSLPVWCEGANHVSTGIQAGKPIITSRRHEDDLCRRHGFTRDYDSRDLE